jgi:transcription initiation factor IIF auxiliary subunit
VFIETEPTQFRKEIKEVVYHLHPTFPNKDVVKTYESEGFILNAQGWGEFIITVELVLYDNRRLVVEHYRYFRKITGWKLLRRSSRRTFHKF